VKIAQFHLHEYALPLKRPLVIGRETHHRRHGCVIELKDETGTVCFGEVAPLGGYSDESQTDVETELRLLRSSLVGSEIPEHLEELSGGFDSWLGRYQLAPSVRFGFESAVLIMAAKLRRVSLARLLSDKPLKRVSVNALLTGDHGEVLAQVRRGLELGYSAFKLKVGGRPVDDDIRLTREVRDLIGPDAALRLDANRRWTRHEFNQFAHEVRGIGIDYIEEPISDISLLHRLTDIEDTEAPLALDESLRMISPDELHQWPGVKAIVLKPTQLGLERAVRSARAATRLGITSVFSSSYESSLGLTIIAHIAAAYSATDTPTGLDTVGVFQEDLLTPSLTIKGGQVVIDELPDVVQSINRDRFKEITDA